MYNSTATALDQNRDLVVTWWRVASPLTGGLGAHRCSTGSPMTQIRFFVNYLDLVWV